MLTMERTSRDGAADRKDVVERISAESRLKISEAVQFVRRRYGDQKIHKNRLRAWLTRGIKTNQGVLRLEGYLLGNVWQTSEEAILRFIAELTRRRAVRTGKKR